MSFQGKMERQTELRDRGNDRILIDVKRREEKEKKRDGSLSVFLLPMSSFQMW